MRCLFVRVPATACVWCRKTGLTSFTEGSGGGRRAAVAGEAAASLHAAPTVPAEGAVAAAVTRAPGPHARGYPRPLLQVQRDAVELQRADAATEAPLPGRRAA